MAELLNGQKRTTMCGNLSKENVGQQVTIMGWVHRRRDLGGLIFLQLRDRSGISQVVFDTDVCDNALLEKASQIKLEYVVSVVGTVRMRTGNNINLNMKTGEIEVVANELKILSEAETAPFSIGDDSANEQLRLKHRYLDLRRPELQNNLVVRSKVCQIVRNYLADNGFLEIETPYLGRSTPEGARDYLVPSRIHAGSFYALPQSPQLYKQLLMIGGMDRYFQIAKCFRDEDLRANRQPEFTQIDMEMSFVDNEVMLQEIVEGLIVKLWKEVKNIGLKVPFARLPYSEAMDKYGSDKPDLRFGMEIVSIDNVAKDSGFAVFENAINEGGTVRAIVAKNACDKFARKELDRLVDFVKTYRVKGLAWHGLGSEGVKSSFAKMLTAEKVDEMQSTVGLENGDIMFVVADADYERAVTALGALRCHLAEKLELINKDDYAITWVVDFPLFEYDEENKRLVAKHHPFTAPKDEDLSLFKTTPAKMRAKAYDLVINGDEMGGGSMRIYSSEIQKQMFEALGFNEEQIKERFGFFVDAFRYGTPPHGGLAFGLDRLIMVLTGTNNIKDVIAFPKIQNASCLMTQAPAPVEDNQLDELSIKCELSE